MAGWIGSHRRRKLYAKVVERDGMRCQWCRSDVVQVERGHRGRLTNKAATLDHVVPICRGGPNTVDNLVIACNDCNQRRGREQERRAVSPNLVLRHAEF